MNEEGKEMGQREGKGGSDFSRVSFPEIGITSEGSRTECSLLSLESPGEKTEGSSVTSGDWPHRPCQEPVMVP